MTFFLRIHRKAFLVVRLVKSQFIMNVLIYEKTKLFFNDINCHLISFLKLCFHSKNVRFHLSSIPNQFYFHLIANRRLEKEMYLNNGNISSFQIFAFVIRHISLIILSTKEGSSWNISKSVIDLELHFLKAGIIK